MPDIPDTDTLAIASLSISWEIVKMTYIRGRSDLDRKSPNEELREITNAVIKAQKAILSQEDNK